MHINKWKGAAIAALCISGISTFSVPAWANTSAMGGWIADTELRQAFNDNNRNVDARFRAIESRLMQLTQTAAAIQGQLQRMGVDVAQDKQSQDASLTDAQAKADLAAANLADTQRRFGAFEASVNATLRDLVEMQAQLQTQLKKQLDEPATPQAQKPEAAPCEGATLVTVNGGESFQVCPLEQYLFEQAKAAFGQQRFAELPELTQTLMQRYPQSGYTPAALYYQGVALNKTGRTALAGYTFKRFVADYPQHPLADQVKQLMAGKAKR